MTLVGDGKETKVMFLPLNHLLISRRDEKIDINNYKKREF